MLLLQRDTSSSAGSGMHRIASNKLDKGEYGFLEGGRGCTFSHFETVPAVMLGESFGIGTMIAVTLSEDIFFIKSWKGDEHEAGSPCTMRKLRRQVMGATILKSGAIIGRSRNH